MKERDVATLRETAGGVFLAIARVVKTQGRRGEVLAEILTDFPERFQNLTRAYIERPGHTPDPVDVQSTWPHKGRMVLKFAGIDSISQAESLAGLHVLIPREERMPLPPHHYYLWELTGCQVVSESDGIRRELGTVTGVELTGGVDLLRVSPRGGKRAEVLIPLAQDICKRIDTVSKTIVIDPPENLLELNL